MFNLARRRCPKVFCKKMFLKLRKIHRKTPVLDSLLIKVGDLQVFSCELCEIFKNTYFEEHLQTAISTWHQTISYLEKKLAKFILCKHFWLLLVACDWYKYFPQVSMTACLLNSLKHLMCQQIYFYTAITYFYAYETWHLFITKR